MGDMEEAIHVVGGTIITTPMAQPSITPSKRSTRLMEKHGGHNFQLGEVASLVSKRKALLSNIEIGTHPYTDSICQLVPNDALTSYAQTIRLDMGMDDYRKKMRI